jgi:hypothetical protein
MNPISRVKLFRGGQLPDLDVPIVIVTFEQTRDEFFFAEYFILYQKSQLLDSCRASCKNAEEAKEYLELRMPEGVIQDMRDAAQAEIEGKVVKSLSKEHQYQWILRAAYTLTPMKFEDLRTLWFRGRVEEPIRQTARITRSMELKRELDRILALPLLKFKEEKPIPPR